MPSVASKTTAGEASVAYFRLLPGRIRFPWWLIVLQVTVALVITTLVVSEPRTQIPQLIRLLGLLWLCGGVFDLIGLFIDHANFGWRFLASAFGILLGWLVVSRPLVAGLAELNSLGYLLAAISVVGAGIGVGRAAGGDGWGVGSLAGVSFVLGMLLLMRPPPSLEMVAIVCSFWTVIAGLVMVVGPFFLRRGSAGAG